MHIHDSRRSRRRSSPSRFPSDYVPVSRGTDSYLSPPHISSFSRPHSRERSRGRDTIVRDYALGASPPVARGVYQENDVTPHHHKHHHHNHSHTSSSSRPAYGRMRSHSFDERDPRLSRSRPGGVYPASPGYGYGGPQSIPQVHHTNTQAYPPGLQTSQMGGNTVGYPYPGTPNAMPQPPSTMYPNQSYPNQQSTQATPTGYGYGGEQMMSQPQTSSIYSPAQQTYTQANMNAVGNSYTSQAPFPSAATQQQGNVIVVRPVSDGRGGFVYTTSQQGHNGPVTNMAVPQSAQTISPYGNNYSGNGVQHTPGFFSRVFGSKGRAQSMAPQPIYAPSSHQHAAKPVQYANSRPRHLHRWRSR